MIVAFGSVKGSPGVTTLALAVALRWPADPPPLLVEADPAGGDLGSRFLLHDRPGLTDLAAAARHAPVTDPGPHLQRLNLGVDVVVAPPSGAAGAVFTEMMHHRRSFLRDLAACGRPVLVDVGRLTGDSRALDLLTTVDELVLLTKASPASLRHVCARLPDLRDHIPATRVVLAGPGPYGAKEIATHLQAPVTLTVPRDRDAAQMLSGTMRHWWGWTHRPLIVAARALAVALTQRPSTVDAKEAAPPAGVTP